MSHSKAIWSIGCRLGTQEVIARIFPRLDNDQPTCNAHDEQRGNVGDGDRREQTRETTSG